MVVFIFLHSILMYRENERTSGKHFAEVVKENNTVKQNRTLKLIYLDLNTQDFDTVWIALLNSDVCILITKLCRACVYLCMFKTETA